MPPLAGFLHRMVLNYSETCLKRTLSRLRDLIVLLVLVRTGPKSIETGMKGPYMISSLPRAPDFFRGPVRIDFTILQHV